MSPLKLLLILGKMLLLKLYTHSDTLNTHLPIAVISRLLLCISEGYMKVNYVKSAVICKNAPNRFFKLPHTKLTVKQSTD